jgi:cytosine/adenosine deaminase-related metal-dependent hydrolase
MPSPGGVPRTLSSLATAVACLLAAIPLPARAQSLVLEGDVVTMDAAGIVRDGRVWIRDGVVQGVFTTEAELSDATGATETKRLETGGWIFPGFVNLHTHVPFNHQPLWVADRKFDNRYQWQADESYVRAVEYPKAILFGQREYNLMNEQTLFAEVRALVGGTTSLLSTRDPGIYTAPGRLVRNIEYEVRDSGGIAAHVAEVDDAFIESSAPALREALDRGELRAWVAHVAEGVDRRSRAEFDRLRRAGLVRREVVIVHGTALDERQLEELGAVGGHLVWAPTSNLLLYGATADVETAMRRGVTVSLSNDWSPSGTHNLLAELKVAAAAYARRHGRALPAKTLVEMITVNPARAIGWEAHAGKLAKGVDADVVAVAKGASGNPFDDLLSATERDIDLVLVNGEPLFGRPDWMERFKPGDSELLSVTGRDGRAYSKRIDVTRTAGDTTLAQARMRLRRALRFDRQDMLEVFLDDDGKPMDPDALEHRLEARYPGLESHELAPVFLANDTEFFSGLELGQFPFVEVLAEVYRPF